MFGRKGSWGFQEVNSGATYIYIYIYIFVFVFEGVDRLGKGVGAAKSYFFVS